MSDWLPCLQRSPICRQQHTSLDHDMLVVEQDITQVYSAAARVSAPSAIQRPACVLWS